MDDQLLWKDFENKESCENCPIMDAGICSGGVTCHGGSPIEPPCCDFDDDTDLYLWIWSYFDRQKFYEQQREQELKEERKRKERAQKAAETRRKMRLYCWHEMHELKQAQKELKSVENLERFAQCFAKATNIANEAFHYEERVDVEPKIPKEINFLRAKVDKAKAAFEAKRKEFYKNRKDGEQK